MDKSRLESRFDEVIPKIDKALQHVYDICKDRARWRMSIPANPEYDSDLILCEALESARQVLAASETSPSLLDVCEALFGCHLSPGHDEYGVPEYRCAECEERIDIFNWVTAEHSASCLINSVRKYLAVHKPQCVPGVKL